MPLTRKFIGIAGAEAGDATKPASTPPLKKGASEALLAGLKRAADAYSDAVAKLVSDFDPNEYGGSGMATVNSKIGQIINKVVEGNESLEDWMSG